MNKINFKLLSNQALWSMAEGKGYDRDKESIASASKELKIRGLR